MMENREIGPELTADGWRIIGGEWMVWMHPPSAQVVSLDAYPRENVNSPAFPTEPKDPKTNGFLVSCNVHDENGNPCEGWGVWIESYAYALKLARELRQRIILDRPTFSPSKQVTFDELLERRSL